MNAPLVIVEEHAKLAGVVRELKRAGFVPRTGFALPPSPWDVSPLRLLVWGLISNRDDVVAAVLAAARGAAVAAATADRSLATVLRADLGRIGTVTAAPATALSGDDLPLDAQQRALLDRLAAGESISAAAQAEFISLRTANRRLAQARGELGVSSTREAVIKYVRERDALR